MKRLLMRQSLLKANIAKQETGAARYSGGLSQAMALSTVATSRQTEAMLEQTRRATIEFQDKDGLVIASRPTRLGSQGILTIQPPVTR